MIKNYGYGLGTSKYINKHSRRTFYRNKRDLKVNYGIDIRSLTSNLRYQEEIPENEYFFYKAL